MVLVVAEAQEFSFLVFVVRKWNLCVIECVSRSISELKGSSGSVLILAQFSLLAQKREVWWLGSNKKSLTHH